VIEAPYDFEDKFFASLQERLNNGNVVERIRNKDDYKNIIEWTVKALGLTSIYQYRRQYQIIRDFFGLLCPKCNKGDKDCWNKTEDELRQEILLHVDYESGYFICPKCGYKLKRLPYNSLVLCIGMRSGKTVTCAIISSYVFFLSLIIPNIEKRFGLIPGQLLRVSMVATAARQTEKTVWGDFIALLKNALDEDVRKISSDSHSEFEISANTREWKVDNLEFLSLHSNSSSLAGGTGALAILEEYSRFITSDSARGSGEVFTVLDRSMKTTRSLAKTALDDYFTLMIVISSPFYVTNDPTLELIYGTDYDASSMEYGESKRGQRLCYHYPTWMFNPFLTRDHFNDEYDRDFFTAERDYGAKPLGAANRFFESIEAVKQSIKPGKGFVFEKTLDNYGMSKFWTAKCLSFSHLFGKEYCVHIDLGLSHDWLSMVFARTEEGHVYVDGMLMIKPDKKKQIYLDTPVDILKQLKDHILFRYVSYDRWQSASAIQRLQAMMILSGNRSVGEADLVSLKQLWYEGNITILDGNKEEVSALLQEVQTIQRVDGKLTHVDLLMGVAGAVNNAYYGFKVKREKGNLQSADNFRKFMPTVGRIGRL